MRKFHSVGEVGITAFNADVQLIFTITQELVLYGEDAPFCFSGQCHSHAFVSDSAVSVYSKRYHDRSTSILFGYMSLSLAFSHLVNISHLHAKQN
jgi:hypothetical protein